MINSKSQDLARSILDLADIKINGSRPWDIRVANDAVYSRVIRDGALGLGEAYMDGWWDTDSLDDFFNRLFLADVEKHAKLNWKSIIWILSQTIFNHQKKSDTRKIGEFHYDLGNDLYAAMLDRRLVYTCGYWKDAADLDEAQEAKLDLVCRKLGLKPGQRILDIGCGWGSFMKFAAERYGVSAVGVTVSKEQVELAKKLCAGLPIELLLMDYRDVKGEFDHVVSLGMFEHVGYKNYKTYMQLAYKRLKDDGLFLLHTIGGNRSTTTTDPWLGKYIFPNSMIPSIKQIGGAIENLFIMEDWHNFGADYDKTLMAWFENFEKHWPKLQSDYDERFFRMWKYFLLSSAAGFRSRNLQLWQIVLSKKGISGGYRAIR